MQAHRTTAAVKLVQGQENDAADALMAAFAQYQKTSAADVAAQNAQFNSTASSSKLMMILVGLIAIVLGSIAAFLLTRSIANRIRKMLTAADAIADGNVDQQIADSSTDEIGATAAAFQRMIDYLKTMVAAAGRLAEGDLSVEVKPRSGQDALGNSFSAMIANLRELVGNLSQAAGSVGQASAQMSTTSEEAGKATGEIAQAIGDVAQGAERQVHMVESAQAGGRGGRRRGQRERRAGRADRRGRDAGPRDRPARRRRGRAGQRGDALGPRLQRGGDRRDP